MKSVRCVQASFGGHQQPLISNVPQIFSDLEETRRGKFGYKETNILKDRAGIAHVSGIRMADVEAMNSTAPT
jgi:hypothetical protein